MTDKKMVVIDYHLMSKIDEARGPLTRSDFVGSCIERLFRDMERARTRFKPLVPVAPPEGVYVTRQEFDKFKENMDKLHQDFMDFFIKYAGQLAGEAPTREEAEQFTRELRRLLML